ncbi:MAG: beta-N-acetylhexosaminidase [Gemmatimonadales bacterium]|nr:beta-N-acetylhexosaminidase [Gemmatimonadales bacterium]
MPKGKDEHLKKMDAARLPVVPFPRSWRQGEGFVAAEKAKGMAPEIRQEPGGPAGEDYRLEISPDAVVVTAADSTGAFHGRLTWRQLQAAAASGLDIPCGVIEDGPAYSWRGMLLDCGRHFMDVAFIKRVIDLLAIHKFNVLHWHLTEDQGWRLEVPGLPRLTEIAAWRAGNSEGPDTSPYGGYYTTADVREILAHAAENHITVVPEIEMPGHCVAALAAYPELSCTGGPFEVETEWGIFPDIYCAGNQETFAFLEKVLAHVMDLFPSRYIHIGGDEAPKDRWRKCSRCQGRITAEGLADEEALQSWFIQRIGKFLAAHGRRMIGWDEILEGGLAPGATVQSWRGFEGATTAVQAGHDAIVSPTSHCYFDYPMDKLDLKQVYSFNPVPPGLTEPEQRRILGGELNLWTERIPQDRVDFMLFPRLCAMAECLWTGPERPGFENFSERLEGHLNRLSKDKELQIKPGPVGNS